MKRILTTLCLTMLLGSAVVSWSADLEKGFVAYQGGDYATALRQWTPLVEQGNSAAQFFLGLLYEEGLGVPQNYETAVKWWTLAAVQGSPGARFKLGLMYDVGRGVPQDYKTAIKWYTLAAERGNADAQFALGLMYAKGQGATQDNVYAYMWWSIAVSSGNRDAVINKDIVSQAMTPTQIEKAKELARECVKKSYKRC